MYQRSTRNAPSVFHRLGSPADSPNGKAEADQKPVAEVAKKHGISDQTIYAWRRRYGSLEPADVKRATQILHLLGG